MITKDIIEISPNGDPFGTGFTGCMSTDGGKTWFYRGDLGSQSLRWWRRYCHDHNYKLRRKN